MTQPAHPRTPTMHGRRGNTHCAIYCNLPVLPSSSLSQRWASRNSKDRFGGKSVEKSIWYLRSVPLFAIGHNLTVLCSSTAINSIWSMSKNSRNDPFGKVLRKMLLFYGACRYLPLNITCRATLLLVTTWTSSEARRYNHVRIEIWNEKV